VTFGFSELVVLFLTNEIWLTRGPLGLPGIDVVSIDLSLFGGPKWEFVGELPYYYLAIVMVLVTVFVMCRIQDSRLGRAWFAIRDDEVAAVSCGINLLAYKVIAFAISAAFGAVGGSFFARWVTFLSPDMFKFWESFLILCMIVLGGMGNIWGVMIGALVLVSLSEVLRELLPLLGLPVEVRFLAFGLIMVLMMRYRPAGLMPIQAVAAQMRTGRVKRKKKKVKATVGMKQ
jgi:branched-chain amino acid transport system permease protein